MLAQGQQEQLCIPRERVYAEEAQSDEGAMYVAAWCEGDRRSVKGGWSGDEVALAANKPPPTWLTDRLLAWMDEINAAGQPGTGSAD